MTDALTAILLLLGGAFMLLGAVGVVRMPDVFSRMQTTTKSMTLGSVCLLLAVVLYFDQLGVGIRAVLVMAFYFLTAPVAAHMIGRAAYVTGEPMWEGTLVDELRGRYDRKGNTLGSEAADRPRGSERGA